MAPPPSSEPHARRTIFVTFRDAALEMWGKEGLRAIGERLTSEARRDTVDAVVIAADWLPEAHAIAWFGAVYEGPAGRMTSEYHRFLDRSMDLGFGRVRRLMLATAMTPSSLGHRAAELWRHDHTHGELTCRDVGARSIVLTLHDHVYATTPLGRTTIAEIYRHISSLTRAKEVFAKLQQAGPATVAVNISWI